MPHNLWNDLNGFSTTNNRTYSQCILHLGSTPIKVYSVILTRFNHLAGTTLEQYRIIDNMLMV